MKLSIPSLFFFIASSVAAQGTITVVVLDNLGEKKCTSSEIAIIQDAAKGLDRNLIVIDKSSHSAPADPPALRRRLEYDCVQFCNEFRHFYPLNLAYCHAFSGGACGGGGGRSLIEERSHDNMNDNCKDQKEIMDSIVTNKTILDGVSKDCAYLLEQTMEIECFAKED